MTDLHDAEVIADHMLELDHDQVCEITFHPNHEDCDNPAAYKIWIFDATCEFWRDRVTCTGCAGSAWIMTVEGRYCPCSSAHARHDLRRFRMEPIH